MRKGTLSTTAVAFFLPAGVSQSSSFSIYRAMIRHVQPKIKIASVDVTRDLFPFRLSISYTDNLSGEADTLDVELVDKDRLFIDDSEPNRFLTVFGREALA